LHSTIDVVLIDRGTQIVHSVSKLNKESETSNTHRVQFTVDAFAKCDIQISSDVLVKGVSFAASLVQLPNSATATTTSPTPAIATATPNDAANPTPPHLPQHCDQQQQQQRRQQRHRVDMTDDNPNTDADAISFSDATPSPVHNTATLHSMSLQLPQSFAVSTPVGAAAAAAAASVAPPLVQEPIVAWAIEDEPIKAQKTFTQLIELERGKYTLRVKKSDIIWGMTRQLECTFSIRTITDDQAAMPTNTTATAGSAAVASCANDQNNIESHTFYVSSAKSHKQVFSVTNDRTVVTLSVKCLARMVSIKFSASIIKGELVVSTPMQQGDAEGEAPTTDALRDIGVQHSRYR
jgi:hypothetical protein